MKTQNPKRGTAEYSAKLQNEKQAEAKRQGRSLINIEIELSTGGVGQIICKEMNCDFPTRCVVASVGALVAEAIERLRAESDPFPPLRPARFWPYQQPLESWEANYPIN